MTYVNDKGQLDTFFRPLPRTDDSAEAMEYLLEWWRSKRECEAALLEGMPPAFELRELLTEEAMLAAEEIAIEALLDALAGTQSGMEMWETRRLAFAVAKLDLYEDFSDLEAAARSNDAPEEPEEWLRARREVADALREWREQA